MRLCEREFYSEEATPFVLEAGRDSGRGFRAIAPDLLSGVAMTITAALLCPKADLRKAECGV